MIKKILLINFLILFSSINFLSSFNIGNAKTFDDLINIENENDFNAKSVILFDENGLILMGKNIKKKMPIASISKLMSMYIILEKIKNDNIDIHKRIYPSLYVEKLSKVPGISNVTLYSSFPYLIEDVIKHIVLRSSNSGVVFLAEHLFGSEEKFVQEMNIKAKEFNMNDTIFYNASGIDKEDMLNKFPKNMTSDGNVSTALDLSKLIKRLYKDHKEYIKYSKIFKAKIEGPFGDEYIENSNQLIKGGSFYYPTTDGLKTGSNPKHGYSISLTANRTGNDRVFGVVLNSKDENERFRDARNMLLSHYKYQGKEILPKDYTDEEILKIGVKKSYQMKTNLYTTNSFVYDLNNDDISSINWKIELDNSVSSNNSLYAPLKAGTKVGKLKIDTQKTKNIPLSFIDEESKSNWGINLYIKDELTKSNLFYRFITSIYYWFKDIIYVNKKVIFGDN